MPGAPSSVLAPSSDALVSNSFLVTTSKALVPSSLLFLIAFLLLLVRHLLLLAMHLFLVAMPFAVDVLRRLLVQIGITCLLGICNRSETSWRRSGRSRAMHTQ